MGHVLLEMGHVRAERFIGEVNQLRLVAFDHRLFVITDNGCKYIQYSCLVRVKNIHLKSGLETASRCQWRTSVVNLLIS